MERNYWLLRERKHVAHARDSASSDIKLIHLDLAGRYSVKAAASQGDAIGYEELEIGARWLASRALSDSERAEHLAMANKYARLRLDTPTVGTA
jgi:hypothetical protein